MGEITKANNTPMLINLHIILMKGLELYIYNLKKIKWPNALFWQSDHFFKVRNFPSQPHDWFGFFRIQNIKTTNI